MTMIVSANRLLNKGVNDANNTTENRVKEDQDGADSRKFLKDLRTKLGTKGGYFRLKTDKHGQQELRRTTRPRWCKLFGGARSTDQRTVGSKNNNEGDKASNLISDHFRNGYKHLRDVSPASRQAYDDIMNDLSDYLDKRSGNLGANTYRKVMARLDNLEKRCEAFSQIKKIPTPNLGGRAIYKIDDDEYQAAIVDDLKQHKEFSKTKFLGKGGQGSVVELKGSKGLSSYVLKINSVPPQLEGGNEKEPLGDVRSKDLPKGLSISKPAIYYIEVRNHLDHVGLYQVPANKLDEFKRGHDATQLSVKGIIMPRMAGEDVLKIAEKKGGLKTDGLEMKTVARDTIKTLFKMHEKGFVFHDVKPENLVYKKPVNNRDATSSLVDTGMVDTTPNTKRPGTKGFAAPELHNEQGHGGEVDFYSMAMTLLEINQPGIADMAAKGFDENSSKFVTMLSGEQKLKFVLQSVDNHDASAGFELKQALKADPAFRTLVVTLMEASRGGSDEERAYGKKAEELIKYDVLPKYLGIEPPPREEPSAVEPELIEEPMDENNDSEASLQVVNERGANVQQHGQIKDDIAPRPFPDKRIGDDDAANVEAIQQNKPIKAQPKPVPPFKVNSDATVPQGLEVPTDTAKQRLAQQNDHIATMADVLGNIAPNSADNELMQVLQQDVEKAFQSNQLDPFAMIQLAGTADRAAKAMTARNNIPDDMWQETARACANVASVARNFLEMSQKEDPEHQQKFLKGAMSAAAQEIKNDAKEIGFDASTILSGLDKALKWGAIDKYSASVILHAAHETSNALDQWSSNQPDVDQSDLARVRGMIDEVGATAQDVMDGE